MKWQERRQSTNIEDRRGASGGRRIGGGAFRLGPTGLIILILIALITKTNPLDLIGGLNGAPVTQTQTQTEQRVPTELEQFSKVVMADLEDVWTDIFAREGRTYQPPTLVFYDGQVRSGCGVASSATGPFYCPADERVYIDLRFYDQLKNQFGAPGDFAYAYVLAHEVGHHVQNQLGITDQVFALRKKMSEQEFNTNYLVRVELQADYFAGVFAHYVKDKGYLEAGDIQEAMNAAHAVGDDTIQEKTMGEVIPDRFTHGTSEQRMKWFEKGLKEGTIEGGNVFEVENP